MVEVKDELIEITEIQVFDDQQNNMISMHAVHKTLAYCACHYFVYKKEPLFTLSMFKAPATTKKICSIIDTATLG